MAALWSYTPLSKVNTDAADRDQIRAAAVDILFNTDAMEVCIISPIKGILTDLISPFRMGRLLLEQDDARLSWSENNGLHRRIDVLTPDKAAERLHADYVIIHCPNVSAIPPHMRVDVMVPLRFNGCKDIRLFMSEPLYEWWLKEEEEGARAASAPIPEREAAPGKRGYDMIVEEGEDNGECSMSFKEQ